MVVDPAGNAPAVDRRAAELSWSDGLMAAAVIAVGAMVQGSVGFGSALIAAPVLALIDPVFVPAPMIMASLTITLMVAYRERRALDLRAVGWVVAGRVPGTGLGILALLALPQRQLGFVFAVLVLLAVVMLAMGRAPTRTRVTLFAAGLVAGVMGTVTSIGGPPVALMFHDARGSALRGTLSAFFLLATLMSLLGLLAAGLLGTPQVLAYGWLLPGVVAGFLASHGTRAHLDRGYTRPAVLCLSALAAVGVILRNL